MKTTVQNQTPRVRHDCNSAINTVALVAAVVLAMPTTGVSATNITGHVTLAADADWRGLGPVALADGATLNLNEHTLKVDELAQSPNPGEDVTSSSGVVTSSALFAGSAEILFDNDFRYDFNNHRICVNGEGALPFTVTYDFGAGNGKCLRAYKIYFQGSSGNRAPKNWKFEGSNDNAAWTTLDTRTGVIGWKNPESRIFSFKNISSYRYYRLRVTAVVDGYTMEMYQLEYFTSPAEYLDPVDLTVPDPARVSSSALFGDSSATNLFDNNFIYVNPSHRLIANTFPCDIVYDFGEGGETVLNGYRIYYNSGSTGRNPLDWRFEGSNDNVNWTTLDIRDNVTNWTKGVGRDFWFANGTPWRYYRLRVTRADGGCIELYQLEYFCRPSVLSKSELSGIDFTVPGGDVSQSTASPSGGSVAALFDNDFTWSYAHRLLVAKEKLPFSVVYDFGTGVQTNVTSYRIYYSEQGQARWPQEWSFAGSNDNANWTTLDSRAGIGSWPRSQFQTFSFKNPNDYRYYRLEFKRPASGPKDYVEIYQIEFFGGQDGELHVDVPAAAAQTNSCIAMDGALRFVKDGAGSFTAAFPGQTYHGGTVVSNGTFVAGLAGNAAPLGKPNGTGEDFSAVTICADGLFDVNGLGGWWNYPFSLCGGTLRCAMAETGAPEDTFRYVSLGSDSRIEVEGNFVMGDGTGTDGCLDLGGHTLTASVSSNGLWTLALPSVTAGTIAFDLKRADASQRKKVMAWEAAPAGVNFTKAESGYHDIVSRSDGVYTPTLSTIISLR